MDHWSVVRDSYDRLASSSDPAQASYRPGTTDREFSLMVRDVLGALDLKPGHHDVLDIGCGTGILGVPIAERVRRYVGRDLSSEAIAAFARVVDEKGLTARVDLGVLDIINASAEEISDLGVFDRVLLYGVLGIVSTPDEGCRMIERTVGRLAPGGRAVVGNVPLADLHPSQMDHGGNRVMSITRSATWLTRWVMANAAGLPHTRLWRLRSLAYRIASGQLYRAWRRLRDGRARQRFVPASLAGTNLMPTAAMIEEWLRPLNVHWEWRRPKIGTPAHAYRADLIIERRR